MMMMMIMIDTRKPSTFVDDPNNNTPLPSSSYTLTIDDDDDEFVLFFCKSILFVCLFEFRQKKRKRGVRERIYPAARVLNFFFFVFRFFNQMFGRVFFRSINYDL